MAKKKPGAKPKKNARGKPTKKKSLARSTPSVAKRTQKQVKAKPAKHKPGKATPPTKRKPVVTKSKPEERSGAGKLASPAALKKFMDAVRKNLSRHCVLLACAPQGAKSYEEWELATGILLNLGGRKVIVTAGHWAEKAQAWKDNGTLEAVFVTFTHVSGDLTTRKLSPEGLTTDNLRIARNFDAAIILPANELTADIEAQGNQYFTEEQVMHGTTTTPHLVILCGYPVQGAIVTKSLAFYSKMDGNTYRHDKLSLGSFAFQSTLLRPMNEESSIFAPGFDCDANEFAFRPTLGKINSRPESGVTSAKGMSGGPVVAIVADPKDGDTFFKPMLLGVQSEQRSIERSGGVEITRLKIVGIQPVIKWIKETLGQM
jgi:hypothetical protein